VLSTTVGHVKRGRRSRTRVWNLHELKAVVVVALINASTSNVKLKFVAADVEWVDVAVVIIRRRRRKSCCAGGLSIVVIPFPSLHSWVTAFLI
jgi:hypothetical protein